MTTAFAISENNYSSQAVNIALPALCFVPV